MSEVTQGHETLIKTSSGKMEAEFSITSISSTFPAVVVVDGEIKLQNYDVVFISGAIPDQVNGFHQVKVSGTGITLMGDTVANFTGLQIDVSNAKIAKVVMSSWCQAKGLNVTTFTIEEEDESVLCKKDKQTNTKINPGSISLDNFYRGDNELYKYLRHAARNSLDVFIQLQHEDGDVWGWRAKITKFDYSAQVNNKMTLAIDFKFNSLDISEEYA
jgi:hypothetical protein